MPSGSTKNEWPFQVYFGVWRLGCQNMGRATAEKNGLFPGYFFFGAEIYIVIK